MRFSPKTKEELDTFTLMPEGIYQFEVVSAENTTSKSGNAMIKIVLNVWDDKNVSHLLFDYLLEAMPHKLRHFCEITGLINKYEHGEIDASDCRGKAGHVEVTIRDGIMRPDGTKYSPSNSVKDYVTKSKAETTLSSKQEVLEDDDVPF